MKALEVLQVLVALLLVSNPYEHFNHGVVSTIHIAIAEEAEVARDNFTCRKKGVFHLLS